MAQPKAFVGSDTCKMCHLEHYDSWKMTLHSRMTQDAQKNRDVIIADFDEKKIREDLAKLDDKLKVPADKICIPKVEEIKYTIGSQWKQRYIVEKEGVLYISPVQYNADTDRWVNYHEGDWDKRPWLLKCGGCHATGVDLEKQKFVEPAVGCEACHGKGSWHAALPKTAVFEKRQTIVNPAKLTMRDGGRDLRLLPQPRQGHQAQGRGLAGGLRARQGPGVLFTSRPPLRAATPVTSTATSSPRPTTSSTSTGSSPSTSQKA